MTTTDEHDAEPLSECEEVGEHRDARILREQDGCATQFECRACGAEWFEDED